MELRKFVFKFIFKEVHVSTWRGCVPWAYWALTGGVARVSVPGVNSELGGVGRRKSVRAPQGLKWIRKV